MKILITGGAGFIGSSLIEHLNKLGYYDVDIYHPNWFSKWKNTAGLTCKFLDRDIFRWETLSARGDNQLSYDLIFHLAANSSTFADPSEENWNNNTVESIRLIKYAISAKIPIIYASSGSVYGAEEENFKERVRGLTPLNFYAFTKLSVDCFIESLSLSEKSYVHSFRFFNVYGGKRENYKGKMSSVIAKWSEELRSGKKIRLLKSARDTVQDGCQSRDFIHVNDICKVLVHFAFRQKAPGGIYNLGSGTSTSYLDLAAKLVYKIQGSYDFQGSIEWIDMPSELKDQYQYRTCADITKLRVDGKYYDPFLTIDEGVNLILGK